MNIASPNVVSRSKYGPVIINVLDEFIGKSIIRTGGWSDEDINLIRELLEYRIKKNNTAIFYDVGANIGTHSLAIAQIFKKRIRIRAFEAQPAIFNMFCGTMALNNINNVRPHLNVVSDVNGDSIELEVPDYLTENNFGGFEIIPPAVSDNKDMKRSGEIELVQTIRLDSFNEPVDLIKMDIEGMEYTALKGAVNLLETHRPFLFIEIIKSNKDILFEFIRNYKYKIYLKGDNAICLPIESPLGISGCKAVV